jgi:hypothetical protein
MAGTPPTNGEPTSEWSGWVRNEPARGASEEESVTGGTNGEPTSEWSGWVRNE